MKRRLLSALAVLTLAACGEPPKTLKPPPAGPVPDTFRVAFETTKGKFVVEVYKKWAPIGAKRFYELAGMGAFDDNAFYRVVPNFVAQWGTPGDPKITATLDSTTIPDEKRIAKNDRGTIAFAQEGKNSRSHTFFINRRANDYLDQHDFVPFGKVIEGMAVVDSLAWPYLDRPDHDLIARKGNAYLRVNYPKADYIRSATLIR
jgi:cyclophilin family peptidyl-prolyl cis-trans isomerase